MRILSKIAYILVLELKRWLVAFLIIFQKKISKIFMQKKSYAKIIDPLSTCKFDTFQ